MAKITEDEKKAYGQILNRMTGKDLNLCEMVIQICWDIPDTLDRIVTKYQDLELKNKQLEKQLEQVSKHKTVESLREKYHEYAKYDDLSLYDIVCDPGCVGEYTQGFKDYVRGYIDMGLIKYVEEKDYGVPEKYLHKSEIEES